MSNSPVTQYEGYLNKKCVLVYWLKGKSNAREAVPKLWKYVTRYFFVADNTLCYTKTKKEKEKKKKFRVMLSLAHLKDITFTHKKITMITTTGEKFVLKGSADNVTGWVAFLVPFKDNQINNNEDQHVPRTFPRRRETLTKYPSLSPSPSPFISAPNLLSATPTFGSSLSSLRKHTSASSASSSPNTTPRSDTTTPRSDTTTPRSDTLIDERVPWRENATLRPYKPHEHSETYIPIHHERFEKHDLSRVRSSSKSPCTSSGSLVSSWSMNNIAEWDEPAESNVSDAQDPQAMSWDEWDAIFIKSQSLENVPSYLTHVV